MDLQKISEIADVIAGICALVAAIQAWRAHSKADETQKLVSQIRVEIAAKQNVNVNVTQRTKPENPWYLLVPMAQPR
jgi:hypothetical protein